jgi:hypothetical protein
MVILLIGMGAAQPQGAWKLESEAIGRVAQLKGEFCRESQFPALLAHN